MDVCPKLIEVLSILRPKWNHCSLKGPQTSNKIPDINDATG